MGRVVVLGSLNVDLVTRVERHPRPGETLLGEGLERLAGGKGANQAVAAAAAGAQVAMVGCVGDDDAGAAYRRRLARLGIDVSAVHTVAGTPTGHALVAVDDAGENTIIVVPGANHLTEGQSVHDAIDALRPGDVLLMQLELPVPEVARAARSAAHIGARVVINAAPYAALPADVVALADPVVVNEHEALALAEAGLVPASTLVTFGAHGISWDGEQFDAVPVPPDAVVDTTGAGDAFCGALAAALATGADRDEAARRALQAGADAVRHAGAQSDARL
ncbi:MAG: ribokinase [Micrococcales bacterium]|nr:ribokinase [Micrococcales bacterium]